MKYILPKTHLSWSAINTWNTNPERFRREYFEGGEKLNTKYLKFGSGIAKLIEQGKHKEILPDLPTYEVPEFEMRCEVGDVPMLGYIDSYDPWNNVFYEFKTGKIPWTQEKVQKHDQLLVYAVMLKHSVGEAPKYCDLVWIETEDYNPQQMDFWRDEEPRIHVTGKIKVFHRVFHPKEIERMEQLIKQSAEEISEAYQSFIKEI